MPDAFAILPRPAHCAAQPGVFALGPQTVIVADAACRSTAEWLRSLLAPATGYPLPLDDKPGGQPAIRLALDPTAAGGHPEGYCLEVAPDGVQVHSAGPAGVFYGLQTLRQLLPPAIEDRRLVPHEHWVVPCAVIEDAPRFGWRGFMLDEGRHFHGKAAVLRLLDLMALQKLNVFHWHLTEDQGWRIEIKRYPRLTEIGAWRPGTRGGLVGRHDGRPHGGFYTQDDIRAVVAYAAARQIMVVPEIEMPGHARAALAAYPELGCRHAQLDVATGPGIYRDLLCAGSESTYDFVAGVLDEVVGLFPAPYVHIGGDEAPLGRWHRCPACQARLRREYLRSEHQLHGYFTNRVAALLAQRGRRLIGWNQVLDEALDERAVVQYWIRGRSRVIAAAQAGRAVVNSDHGACYLDLAYAFTPLSAAYAFDPLFPGLDTDGARHLLGLEALLWTEWVPDQQRLDYQVFPRLPALAEAGWTAPSRRDYADFRRRLLPFLQRLDRLGVAYAPLADVDPNPVARRLGVFTMFMPQRRTAASRSSPAPRMLL